MTQTYTRLRPWAKRTRTIVGGAIILAFSASQCLANDANHRAAKKPSTPFEDARIIIEFNSTDQDVGVQFFLDVDSWQTVQILDPRGKEIYQSTAKGRLLRQGGGTELFMQHFVAWCVLVGDEVEIISLESSTRDLVVRDADFLPAALAFRGCFQRVEVHHELVLHAREQNCQGVARARL